MGGYTSGSDYNDIVDYITIASTGNATDFGDLTTAVNSASAAASSTRALCAGGTQNGGTPINDITYFTIASTGNATSFGNLTTARTRMGSASGAHGGLA